MSIYFEITTLTIIAAIFTQPLKQIKVMLNSFIAPHFHSRLILLSLRLQIQIIHLPRHLRLGAAPLPGRCNKTANFGIKLQFFDSIKHKREFRFRENPVPIIIAERLNFFTLPRLSIVSKSTSVPAIVLLV